MPAEKKCMNAIQPLYKLQYIDNAMYNFVEAIRYVLPGFSIEDCLKKFQEYYRFSEDDFNIDSAKVIYQRIKKIHLQHGD